MQQILEFLAKKTSGKDWYRAILKVSILKRIVPGDLADQKSSLRFVDQRTFFQNKERVNISPNLKQIKHF